MSNRKNKIIEDIITTKEYRSLSIEGDNKENYILEGDFQQLIYSKDLFNLDTYGISMMKNTFYMDVIAHKHAFFEVQYVYSGTVVQAINGKRVELPKGALTFFNKETVHSIPRSQEKNRLYHIGINETFLGQDFIGMLNPESDFGQYIQQSVNGEIGPEYLLMQCDDKRLVDLLEMMNTEFLTRSKGSDKNLQLYLALFLNKAHQVLVQKDVSKELSAVQDRIKKIEGIISQEYKEITLTDLAEKIHVHPNYLSKFIRQHMGCKFSELLTDERMHRACYLLVATDESVEFISREVGYKNVNYFYKAFKSKYGVTPKGFRKENRK